MHKITGDMTKIAAQIPALFESLSGMRMSDLLGKVKTITDREPGAPTEPRAPASGQEKE
jgi:flotillin